MTLNSAGSAIGSNASHKENIVSILNYEFTIFSPTCSDSMRKSSSNREMCWEQALVTNNLNNNIIPKAVLCVLQVHV